jgi:DNA helicase HerA-like ATPase
VARRGDQRLELSGLPAYRITEIPRPDDPWLTGAAPGGGADRDRPQRAAALAAAYHSAGPGAAPGAVAYGWVRLSAGGPVHVIAAGVALAGSVARDGDVLLSLPGGARGTPMPPGALTALLDGLPAWREIAGISDGLLIADHAASQAGSAPAAPALEDTFLRTWTGPFGFMVTAVPVPPAELRAMADGTARRLHLAESAADRFPGRAVETRRLTHWHAELRRGFSTGFWSIRVAVGGADEASAPRLAGLFCGSAALDGLPYRLIPGAAGQAETAEPEAAGPGERAGSGAEAVPGCPIQGSTELLAALLRPPESEVPGVRLVLRPGFDVTPETRPPSGSEVPPGDSGPELTIGEVLDRNLMPAGPFAIPLDSLNRHVFVCGATGAGKSQTVRTLLEAASARGIPWLVVEPAKAEYRLMANRLPAASVIRIRPGEADAIAAGLNPLEPAAAGGATFPLQTHADLVRALFVASFRSEEPFPQVLSAALARAYEEAGWDLALGEPRAHHGSAALAYPALGDLQRAAESVVGEIGYSQRVTDDVLGFIRVRIASLRAGTTGRFLEGGHPVDFGKLLTRNVVLEIEDVGDDRDKAFLMGTVLIRLVEHLRLTRAAVSPGLRHLTVIEEAHRLLRRAEPGEHGAGAHAVEMFAGLLAEIRAYGEGLIVAEQIPARVIADVVKNTAVKITHRLPAADDREAVGATMNVTPAQSRYLVTLPPGQAAAFADGMDYPVLIKIPDSTEREIAAAPSATDCADVVTPRSGSCAPDCAARPCTLRDMRQAQRVLAEYPWLPLWAELTVAAHLAGWPMPVPAPAALAGVREVPERLVRCAVSHAADAAVAARTGRAGHEVDPGGLAAHAAAAIWARASRDTWLCPADEPEWRLPGPVTEALVLGAIRPSLIESAGGLLTNFVDCRWPLMYLTGSRAQG